MPKRFRIFSSSNLKKSDTEPIQPLAVNINIGASLKGPFISLEFIIDTGFTAGTLGITEDLANQIGIAPIGKQTGILADGQKSTLPIGFAAILYDDFALDEIPCVINTPRPIIGLDFLRLFDVYIQNGQLRLFRLSEKAVRELQPSIPQTSA